MAKTEQKQIEGTLNVCCHTVVYCYWDFQHELTDEQVEQLKEQAEERAKECIIDGYHSGQLVGYLYFDNNNTDEEILGWWEIKKD